MPSEPRRGIDMMWAAARQGLPAALEQLGRYYYEGTLVQQNRGRAAPLMQEAASLGFEKAQFIWAAWLLEGAGSPLDYPQAYLWLKQIVTDDQGKYRRAEQLSAGSPNACRRPECGSWRPSCCTEPGVMTFNVSRSMNVYHVYIFAPEFGLDHEADHLYRFWPAGPDVPRYPAKGRTHQRGQGIGAL
ncbi:hypothetical protein MBH78_10065 [Oceanimonas sp. NS1]|nr:hypothetical protein [Oceanimonas sp. NS1]